MSLTSIPEMLHSHPNILIKIETIDGQTVYCDMDKLKQCQYIVDLVLTCGIVETISWPFTTQQCRKFISYLHKEPLPDEIMGLERLEIAKDIALVADYLNYDINERFHDTDHGWLDIYHDETAVIHQLIELYIKRNNESLSWRSIYDAIEVLLKQMKKVNYLYLTMDRMASRRYFEEKVNGPFDKFLDEGYRKSKEYRLYLDAAIALDDYYNPGYAKGGYYDYYNIDDMIKPPPWPENKYLDAELTYLLNKE